MVLGSIVRLPDYFRQVVNGLQVSKVCSVMLLLVPTYWKGEEVGPG